MTDTVLATPVALALDAAPDVAAAVAELGRTEDVLFSADGRRLAVAGFGRDCIALFEIDVVEGGSIEITGCTEVRCPAFGDPHGLAFLDDDLIVVANRRGAVVILAVPPPLGGVHCVTVEPLCTIDRVGELDVHTPGSVAVVDLAPGLHEILVCNNYAHRVTRHVFNSRSRRLERDDVVLAAGLEVPDGIAVSRDGRWIAVSSHCTHEVVLYERVPGLGPATEPSAHLIGIAYPHGLRFTHDDQCVIVADAGAPFVHSYACDGAAWSGTYAPISTVRVMDDDTFQRGRTGPEEGGPKGLALDLSGGIVVVSSEHQPLACFLTADVLGSGLTVSGLVSASSGVAPSAPGAHGESARSALLDEMATTAALRSQVEALELHQSGLDFTWDTLCAVRAENAYLRDDNANLRLEVDGLRRSTSWRVTAPLRRLSDVVRRMRGGA